MCVCVCVCVCVRARPSAHAHVCVFRITPGGSFPASLTIKEEPSPIVDAGNRLSQSQSSESQLSQSSDQEGEVTPEKSDVTYLSHHPRPSAVMSACPLFTYM